MQFKLEKTDKNSKARVGKIVINNHTINTPIFMPVGTCASVKAVHQHELANDINAEIILANTYHLYLRPKEEIINKAGGLHKFMNWNKPILTDSGGFQVYSLSNRVKIKEEGVNFKSHIDGSNHFFSPEKVIDIQRNIGADIIMAFDECTPYPCDYSYAKKSMEMTHRWLKRCVSHFENNSNNLYVNKQVLFPIVQGSTYKDLRKESAKIISEYNLTGNAIGGLSVGETDSEMYSMTDIVTDILPKDKPRYLMGVGSPINILENIALGIDMFDCVMPSRNARNGFLFTINGTINIKNKKWEKDYSLICEYGNSYVDKTYSKSYLRHLFMSNEILGKQIATIHNLSFYLNIVDEARNRIRDGSFYSWKNKIVKKLNVRL
ncbi:MAG: tRNA guanosine(34) transglycosylase Tgt [Flavobacteriales bacterium TMED288]|nr:tRNA guanosine(34) transglycosylase Tgt [Flavobacteriales bacterium]RPG53655.1 MAG: tRNA guanosine(34) transglycosylase Tgt [Flavobacteriales bacterium TMED288]|tara:strand:+ start:2051 stop:3184 length:1134 start_codon:yes stop_codon:yes gene_type:complete